MNTIPTRIDKRHCRDKTNNEIKAGRLFRGSQCLYCHSIGTEAHHPDHRKWDEILWLCKSCHKKVDADEQRQADVLLNGEPITDRRWN